jgi:hypothetical protein
VVLAKLKRNTGVLEVVLSDGFGGLVDVRGAQTLMLKVAAVTLSCLAAIHHSKVCVF